MIVTRSRDKLLAAVLVALSATAASAAPADQRIAEVMAERVRLQRSLSEWLGNTLAQPAAPYRVDPVVQVFLKGEMREFQQSEETTGGDVKFGGTKTQTKLPGLGYADTGGGGGSPEVILKGSGRKVTRTVRELDMTVTRMVIRLFVDPAMPTDRREVIRSLAVDLAGIETARGDELHIADLPGSTARSTPQQAIVPGMPAASPAAAAPMLSDVRHGGLDASHAVTSVTAIVAALIVAFGLTRRGRGEGRGEDEREAGGGGVEIADGRVIDLKGGAAARASGPEKRKDGGAFAALAELSTQETAEVLAEVDPVVAAAIIESLGLSEEAGAIFCRIAPETRVLEVGLWLGKQRVIARTELNQMEAAAAQALARVRSRVAVGGATRLASFLAIAPDETRSTLLAGISNRDAEMANAVRKAMVLFGDLANLSDKSIRRVLSGTDPAVIALALVNAPAEFREQVLGAVSKRLRAIIEGEEEAVKERPGKDVDAARRLIERAMFHLHARGELVPRAA